MKKFKIILLFVIISFSSYGQDCNDFFNYSKNSNCNKCIKANYYMYMPPKHIKVGLNDTLTYNVAFSGKRDYMISFCADQLYYPLNIRILDPKTKKILYDNAKDYYVESIGVGVYNTQNLILQLIMKAENVSKDEVKSNEKVCVGMILQWKKILSKSNKLYLNDKRPT